MWYVLHIRVPKLQSILVILPKKYFKIQLMLPDSSKASNLSHEPIFCGTIPPSKFYTSSGRCPKFSKTLSDERQ